MNEEQQIRGAPDSQALPERTRTREAEQRARDTADMVARRSYGKLVAFLAVRMHDVAAAEDALSEAFAAALADWPLNGCPDNPEAWLMTVARRRLIDVVRGQQRGDVVTEQLKIRAEGLEAAAAEKPIPDQRLALLFACAHPAIDPSIHAPLMLQAVLRLDAAMIASAFLVSPTTMSQRLVRAKNKIRQAGIPFRIPEPEELPGRLAGVLDAIYAAFAEGWIDAAGTDVARRDLAGEAIFLCRVVTELLPDEPEALGLLALMLHAEARRPARRGPQGEYIPLAEQDPDRWNEAMVEEGEAALFRASEFATIGRFQLEAAIQSAHVARRRTGINNWPDVVRLYDALLTVSGSPVVAINRALAVAETEGVAAALSALEEIAADRRLAEYQPYWAARAELLVKTGARDEARHAYDVAIGLEREPSVRTFLLEKRQSIGE